VPAAPAAMPPPYACLTQITTFRQTLNCFFLQFICIGVWGEEAHNYKLEILAYEKES
jgi:hypothetical protein